MSASKSGPAQVGTFRSLEDLEREAKQASSQQQTNETPKPGTNRVQCSICKKYNPPYYTATAETDPNHPACIGCVPAASTKKLAEAAPPNIPPAEWIHSPSVRLPQKQQQQQPKQQPKQQQPPPQQKSPMPKPSKKIVVPAPSERVQHVSLKKRPLETARVATTDLVHHLLDLTIAVLDSNAELARTTNALLQRLATALPGGPDDAESVQTAKIFVLDDESRALLRSIGEELVAEKTQKVKTRALPRKLPARRSSRSARSKADDDGDDDMEYEKSESDDDPSEEEEGEEEIIDEEFLDDAPPPPLAPPAATQSKARTKDTDRTQRPSAPKENALVSANKKLMNLF